jgi:hypothetical protein
MTYNKAKSIIMQKFKDSNIVLAFEIDSGFVFSIRPMQWDSKDMILDAFFMVDKKHGKVSEYSPLMNSDEFKYSIKNRIIYVKR